MAAAPLRLLEGATPRVMTRCECTGIAFAEVARLVREEGLGLEQVCERSGCGHTCTACIPDLCAYLQARGLGGR